jgi:hypothetical protein
MDTFEYRKFCNVMTFAENPNSTHGRYRVTNWTPPALAAWSINFSLLRLAASASRDTTDFSPVEFQFRRVCLSKDEIDILHATEVGGVSSPQTEPRLGQS